MKYVDAWPLSTPELKAKWRLCDEECDRRNIPASVDGVTPIRGGVGLKLRFGFHIAKREGFSDEEALKIAIEKTTEWAAFNPHAFGAKEWCISEGIDPIKRG